MSNLLWGTLALGVLALGALAAYNAWELRRARGRRARSVEPTTLEPAERIEPTFGPHGDGAARAAEIAAADSLPAVPPAGDDPLDDEVFAVASIDYAQPVAGAALIAALPGSLRAGSKPVEVRGLDAESGAWRTLDHHASYTRLAAGVLLANRSGALNEVEYSDFVAMVQRAADATGGDADFPDMLDAVAQAKDLDEFAAGHDALITVTLRARAAPWSASYLQQMAKQCGFTHGHVAGRMVKLGPDGEAVLLLQFDPQAALADDPDAQPLTRASLVLDVPHVEAGIAPLARLREAAQELGDKLEAAVTDEAGQPLGDLTWAQLQGQLESLYAALAERGLPAGSRAARRLYS
jgi:hypothetical protein